MANVRPAAAGVLRGNASLLVPTGFFRDKAVRDLDPLERFVQALPTPEVASVVRRAFTECTWCELSHNESERHGNGDYDRSWRILYTEVDGKRIELERVDVRSTYKNAIFALRLDGHKLWCGVYHDTPGRWDTFDEATYLSLQNAARTASRRPLIPASDLISGKALCELGLIRLSANWQEPEVFVTSLKSALAKVQDRAGIADSRWSMTKDKHYGAHPTASDITVMQARFGEEIALTSKYYSRSGSEHSLQVRGWPEITWSDDARKEMEPSGYTLIQRGLTIIVQASRQATEERAAALKQRIQDECRLLDRDDARASGWMKGEAEFRLQSDDMTLRVSRSGLVMKRYSAKATDHVSELTVVDDGTTAKDLYRAVNRRWTKDFEGQASNN